MSSFMIASRSCKFWSFCSGLLADLRIIPEGRISLRARNIMSVDGLSLTEMDWAAE